MIEMLAQIDAPSGPPKPFVAGLVLWDDVVVEAAPIVRRMKGWRRERVREHCQRMRWSIVVVHLLHRERPA